jgi:hypothetical protein
VLDDLFRRENQAHLQKATADASFELAATSLREQLLLQLVVALKLLVAKRAE